MPHNNLNLSDARSFSVTASLASGAGSTASFKLGLQEMHELNKSDRLEWQEALGQLVDIHKAIKLTMQPRTKSKAWAIWLLQGTALVRARGAIRDERLGNQTALWANLRFSIEIIDLIAYFNRKTTRRQAAVDWFEGKLYKAPRPRNTKAKEHEEQETQAYREAYKYNWTQMLEVNHKLSEIVHPTYKTAKLSFFFDSRKGLDTYSIERDEMLEASHRVPQYYLTAAMFALLNGRDVLSYSEKMTARLEAICKDL